MGCGSSKDFLLDGKDGHPTQVPDCAKPELRKDRLKGVRPPAHQNRSEVQAGQNLQDGQVQRSAGMWDQSVLDFAKYLGIDPEADREFLWIAQAAMVAPIPQPWLQVLSEEGEPYFIHGETHQTQWEHPLDAYHRDLFHRLRDERAIRSAVSTDASSSVPASARASSSVPASARSSSATLPQDSPAAAASEGAAERESTDRPKSARLASPALRPPSATISPDERRVRELQNRIELIRRAGEAEDRLQEDRIRSALAAESEALARAVAVASPSFGSPLRRASSMSPRKLFLGASTSPVGYSTSPVAGASAGEAVLDSLHSGWRAGGSPLSFGGPGSPASDLGLPWLRRPFRLPAIAEAAAAGSGSGSALLDSISSRGTRGGTAGGAASWAGGRGRSYGVAERGDGDGGGWASWSGHEAAVGGGGGGEGGGGGGLRGSGDRALRGSTGDAGEQDPATPAPGRMHTAAVGAGIWAVQEESGMAVADEEDPAPTAKELQQLAGQDENLADSEKEEPATAEEEEPTVAAEPEPTWTGRCRRNQSSSAAASESSALSELSEPGPILPHRAAWTDASGGDCLQGHPRF